MAGAAAALLRWSRLLALIGRNLSNEYVVARSASDTMAPKRSGGVAELPVDLFGSVSRGREVLFQVTRKF